MLSFSQTDTLIISPAGGISGGGTVSKLGSGLLIFGGNNTYTGATTIAGGTLQIGNGASGEGLASPSINVSSGALLAFNQADTLSISPTGGITGGGTVSKLGNGRLLLGGTNNSYTGGTQLNAGTLNFTVAPCR